MKLFCTLFFAVVVFANCIAQDAKYLEFSLGVKRYQARDEYQSPLTYNGYAFSRGVGYNIVKDDRMKSGRLNWLGGDLSNRAPHKNTLNYNGLNYQHNQLYNVKDQSSFSYFVGISLKTIFGFRSKTNRGQFDTAVSLSLVGAATYKEAADDRWSHEAVLSVPFFAWSVRPRYTAPAYSRSKAKWKGPSHLFMTIPKYFGFDFQIGSQWEMNNGNAFRLNYESQYYQILPLHPVRVFNHGLVGSALMRID